MTILRVWNSEFTGKEKVWGHTSLEVGGTPPAGIYISWWLGDLDERLPAFAENMTLAQDLRLEGKGPDSTHNIPGLDERAIKQWWGQWRGNSLMFVAPAKTCVSTVAKALKAGGADRLASLTGWKDPTVWTPSLIADFAKAISSGYNSRR